MSLKDRNARAHNNKDRMRMIARDDTENINVIRGMVPANSIRGAVAKDPGVDMNEAKGMVAVEWPSYGDVPQAPKCRATTKKGAACKASPIVDEELCVGHRRQFDASGVN